MKKDDCAFTRATFVSELKNRFRCCVKIHDEETMCYVPSSCKLSNFVDLSGCEVLLLPTTGKSEIPFSLYAAETTSGVVLLNLAEANRIIASSIRSRRFAFLGKRERIRREISIDGYKCDLYIEDTDTFDNGITVFKAAAKIQHTNSIVLKISYGGRDILLTGDSDWKSWKEKIVPNFKKTVKSDILVASHHGSRSFFTDEANDTIDIQKNPDTTYMEAIEYIDPDVTLISCGKYETYHHPNEEAEALYKKYSSHSHLLRCKISNARKGTITRIFKVVGV